ncbi:MAG: fibro-slime domain-containing protein [Fibrobacteres bacterium]|nr:fibro-slime domain-containing protein [Fibrobacterota bacterium]
MSRSAYNSSPLRFLPLFGVFVLASVAPIQAAKTLMIMVDYFGQRTQMDTVIRLRVFQPTTEVKMLNGSAPPNPVLTDVYDTERFGWWYALPNFNPDDYAMGRVRFNTSYTRGWYQNDSTYRASAGDTLWFPDTQTTFTYQNVRTGVTTPVLLPGISPNFFVFPDTASYRGPKLYTAAGNSETELLNMRPTVTVGTKSTVQPGALDKCIESIPGDTVWIRWGTPTAPPGQGPKEADMQCTGYNPASTRFGLVNIRNPWPGADLPVVEFNGQDIPLYPNPTNPDWLSADLRYLAPLGLPVGTIRFKRGAGSPNTFDSAGVDQAVIKPFVITNGGANWYFIPSEAGGGIVSGRGTLPKPTHTIYVQNPWLPGSPRLMWEEDVNLHVMRPTQYCGWFSYPLYAAPKRVLIGHSFEDSSYGSLGVQFRKRANWVDIPATAISAKNETWIQTKNAANARIPAVAVASTTAKDCSTDTLKLVMEAFDFQGRGEVGGNPPFQVGGPTESKGDASSGLVKGMVQTSLGTNFLPVYTGRDSGNWQSGGINNQGPAKALPLAQSLWKKSTPTNWFDTLALKAAVPGIAIGHGCVELPLVKNGAKDSGYYKFADTSFFPLDTISDRRGYSPMTATDGKLHNFLFCMHGHAAFEYTPGLKFEFRGDDDVWVFINNKLAVDLGGSHAPESSFVNLDKMRLREGSIYPFDIFYCERQLSGSSILIRTTMDLQPTWKYKAEVTPVGTGLRVEIKGNQKNNFVPTCADLMKPQAESWVTTNGRMVVVGPLGSGLSDNYSSDTALYNGNLIYQGGLITLDTNKLIADPGLMWPGKYTIRVESRLGDSLYTISFTKKFGAVVVKGTVLDGNGDGIADSIRLVAPSALFKAGDNPSSHVVWFDGQGKRDSVIAIATMIRQEGDTAQTISIESKAWGIRTQLPAIRPDSLGVVLTYPSGLLVPLNNPIKLADGIAPVADSAWMVYDTSGTGRDSLYVLATEPLKAIAVSAIPSLAGTVIVGNRTLPRLVSLAPIMIGNASAFVLTFDPALNPIQSGDSLRLGGLLADLVGNSPGLKSVWVKIKIDPIATSWMLDSNGDGAPDSVVISAKGSLASVDSAKVQWKTYAGVDTLVSIPTPGGIGLGLRLPAGILQNATFCQGCKLTVFSGADSRRFPLADSVPAAAISAKYFYGKDFDTLVVKATEAIFPGAIPGEGWLAQKSAGDAGTLGALIAGAGQTFGDTIKLIVIPGAFTGDSVRLRGSAKDKFGTAPGAVSPFVKVVFGSQPIAVAVYDANGDGAADSVVFQLTRGASGGPTPDGFTVQWGGVEKSVAALTKSADGKSWSGPIGPFAAGVTSTPTGSAGWIQVGTDVATWRAAVDDSVPAVALKAAYRYGLGMDSLVVTTSEPVTAGNLPGEGWFGLKNAGSADVAGRVVGDMNAQGQATTQIILMVAPGTADGDSLRLRGWARDVNWVVPGKISPFVPLVYGPQKIRVILRDVNGDGQADDVEYKLTRSASGAPVPTEFGLTWNGVVIKATNLTRSADLMSWRGPIGPADPATVGLPTDMGWITVGTDVDSYRAMVEDSIAPVATSAKLIFGFEPGSADTLEIIGSEPISNTGAALAMLAADPATGTPIKIMSTTPVITGKVLRVVVAQGSITSDVAWARFDRSITDGHNAVGDSSRWVPLKVTPSGRGSMFDSNGDGQADSISVELRGALVATDVVVRWPGPNGVIEAKTWQITNIRAGGFGVRAQDGGFTKGFTSCPSGCTIQFQDNGVDVATWSLLDKVAPMVVSGSYAFGAGTSADTLVVNFSEPVKSLSANPSWVEWGGKGLTGSVNHSPTPVLSANGMMATLYLSGANIASDSWDSVRIASGALAGNLTDLGGTTAGKTSPMTQLVWGIPPMTAAVFDPDGQGRGTQVGVWLSHPVPAAAFKTIKKVTVTWGAETSEVVLDSNSTGVWKKPLATPFALGVTSCASCVGAVHTLSASRLIAVLDSVPPSAIKANFRYSTRAIARDTLTVELSEPWTGGTAGDLFTPLVMVGRPSKGMELDTVLNWYTKAGNVVQFVLDTTWQERFFRGDSVRLSWNSGKPMIKDTVGNLVGEKSRWVPIEYGMRPVEFIIEQLRPIVVNGRGDAPTWPEPSAGTPGIEILVLPSDAKVSSTTDNYVLIGGGLKTENGRILGGLPGVNPVKNTAGVRIKLNRPLDGALFVYDNMGTSVRQIDLSMLKNLWQAGEEDIERDVEIRWNWTAENGKFVSPGVYLMRAVVKYKDNEGKSDFRNLLWKFGWVYEKK